MEGLNVTVQVEGLEEYIQTFHKAQEQLYALGETIKKLENMDWQIKRAPEKDSGAQG